MCNHRLVLVLSLWIGQNTRRRLESENKRGAYKCICISERVAKPSHMFFERLAKAFDLDLSLTVFIDGTPSNIAAAKKFGRQIYHLSR
ncbi:MAG: HAD-IA family hydrolase [Ferrimicrobium sp.]